MKIGINSFFCILLFMSLQVSAGSWIDMNTAINDRLNDVWFSSNYGMIAGNHGIYYTTTGGSGAGAWTRLVLSNNIADSILYEHTQFLKIANKDYQSYYFLGNDTVNHRGVIFTVNYSTHATTVYFKDFNTSQNYIPKNENRYNPTGINHDL